MTVINCRFCAWTLKAHGKYRCHHIARQHVQTTHPSEFASMASEEKALRELQIKLKDKYGLALRPLNMSP